MERHFDEELEELHGEILAIGTLVQEAIGKSIEALKRRDASLAQEVIRADSRIDELDLLIDDRCIDLIALHQPVAGDLRYITTGMKINAELERIADLAVDISQRVLELVDKPLLKPLVDIPKMSDLVQNMVRQSIESFIKKDICLAREVVLSDTEVDKLRNRIQEELIHDYLSRDASTADRAIPLLLITRHLERISDHTTNIAEDVIYMVEAKTVKHHLEELKKEHVCPVQP